MTTEETYSIIHGPRSKWRGLTGASTGNQTSVYFFIDMSVWTFECLGRRRRNWKKEEMQGILFQSLSLKAYISIHHQLPPIWWRMDCIQWGISFSVSYFYASHHRLNILKIKQQQKLKNKNVWIDKRKRSNCRQRWMDWLASSSASILKCLKVISNHSNESRVCVIIASLRHVPFLVVHFFLFLFCERPLSAFETLKYNMHTCSFSLRLPFSPHYSPFSISNAIDQKSKPNGFRAGHEYKKSR